jgi:hypothetical protein
VSTVAVFLWNVATFLVLSGIGRLVRRAFGLRRAAGSDWFNAFWMGFASTISFLILWNFWRAIDAAAFVAVVSISVVGHSDTTTRVLSTEPCDTGNLAKGFVVDGGWPMQIWPDDWLPCFLESWRAWQ